MFPDNPGWQAFQITRKQKSGFKNSGRIAYAVYIYVSLQHPNGQQQPFSDTEINKLNEPDGLISTQKGEFFLLIYNSTQTN